MQEQLKKAQALAAAGREEEAKTLLKKIVESDPRNGQALYRLGIFAAKRDETEEADDYFTRALALAPRAPEVMLSLAQLRLEQGEREEAYRLAGQAGSLTQSPLTFHRLGILYRQAGDIDLARESFIRALAARPDYIPAFYGLRSTGKFAAGDPYFAKLEKLAAGSLAPDDRVAALFTLGRGYLDLGDNDRAFATFAEANALKKSLVAPFDALRFDAYIDSVIRLFDKAALDRLQGQGTNESPRPVFIVGMPRSGSTLADQIVSSHPDATSVGEAKILRRCIPYYPNAELPGLFASGQPSITRDFMGNLNREALDGIASRYLALTGRAAGSAQRVVDKMLFNYLWAGVIRVSMPQAKIIHCTRDPRDIALSLWQLVFPGGMQWTYDLADIGRYYLSYKKLTDHWHGLFPGGIHEVNYETMVAAQEQESKKLVAFCGLPWDARCLDFHSSDRMVKTSSAAQVRRPIYADSSGKWRKYEKYLEPLLSVLAKQG